jgi:phosphoglycerate dehydrogenase-like enzyme
MIDVLRKRPDLTAILDVTYPEPPLDGSPLFELPNVVYTPHIAGSSGAERRRLAAYMIDELKRYLAGQPLQWEIDREKLKRLA